MLALINIIVTIVSAICTVLFWVVIVRIILSWVGVSPYSNYNEILGIIFQISDMVLVPFRRIPLRIGMLDFTPMLAIIVLQYIPQLVAQLLYALLGVFR